MDRQSVVAGVERGRTEQTCSDEKCDLAGSDVTILYRVHSPAWSSTSMNVCVSLVVC